MYISCEEHFNAVQRKDFIWQIHEILNNTKKDQKKNEIPPAEPINPPKSTISFEF